MKKQASLLTLLSIVGMAFGLNAHAYPYGTAGCGLGALVLKDSPGKIQILSATINNIISPQTSAITSGTSNCYDEPQTASTIFIQINKQALMKDIARGNGESLASLSKILQCSDSAQLGNTLQKSYSEIFPSESVTASDINTSIQKTIQSDENLNQDCTTYI
jgi:hypothetical protein